MRTFGNIKRTPLEVAPILRPDDSLTVHFDLDTHNDTDDTVRVTAIEWRPVFEKVQS